MATTLTLRMDERVNAAAKRHAAARRTSVSRMMAAYVEALEALEDRGVQPESHP